MSEEEIQVTESTEEPQETTEAVETVETETTVEEPTEAPVEAAPEPEPPKAAEPPSWMSSLMGGAEPLQEEQKEQTGPDFSEVLKDTILDDETKNELLSYIHNQINTVREETRETADKFKQQERQQAQRAVEDTLQNIQQSLYGDLYNSDPTFQGNEKVAQYLDKSVEHFVKNAAIAAVELGDMRDLKIANHPKFGELMGAWAKIMNDIPLGKSAPINIKGAEVESGTAATAGDTSAITFSAEERTAMKQFGITEKEIIEARELTGNDFSAYDVG